MNIMDIITIIVLITILGSALAIRFGECAETESDPVSVPPPPSLPREFRVGEWEPLS